LRSAQLNGRGNEAPAESIQSGLGSPMKFSWGEHIEDSREEHVISLGDLLQVVWRRLWVIALVALVLAGSVVAYSLTRTPMYEASIKILVGQEQRADVPANLGSDVHGRDVAPHDRTGARTHVGSKSSPNTAVTGASW
jgi:hypothetical protein